MIFLFFREALMNGISVVIPVYNEEDNVAESFREVREVLVGLGVPYEIIMVDDGSRDATVRNLVTAAQEAGVAMGPGGQLRIIEFRRNFGQTAAMAAGFQNTQYDVVVALDGDLQNDPAEIPRMVAKLQEGYDLVCGWRKDRKDKLVSRKIPSFLANRLISWATNVQLHDYGCTLKVMKGDVARGIRLYGEMHRFIPALAHEMGARIAEVPVKHRERRFGVSKYGISRTLRVVLDLMTVKFLLGYSKRPIHLFGTVGLVAGGAGFSMLSLAIFQRLFLSIPMGNRPMMVLGVMLALMGLQFLVFGLIAEVMVRTYYESQNKPIFVIRRITEFSGSATPSPERRAVGNV
jgi:glycosyltransferase involved in cell wall biosynthesis